MAKEKNPRIELAFEIAGSIVGSDKKAHQLDYIVEDFLHGVSPDTLKHAKARLAKKKKKLKK